MITRFKFLIEIIRNILIRAKFMYLNVFAIIIWNGVKKINIFFNDR